MADKCPKCHIEMLSLEPGETFGSQRVRAGENVHVIGGPDCLRRQLAEANEKVAAVVRERALWLAGHSTLAGEKDAREQAEAERDQARAACAAMQERSCETCSHKGATYRVCENCSPSAGSPQYEPKDHPGQPLLDELARLREENLSMRQRLTLHELEICDTTSMPPFKAVPVHDREAAQAAEEKL